MLIRGLTVTDAFAFREIRLEGLQQHPDAFGSSHEEEVEKPNAWFQDTLATGLVVVGDYNADLVVENLIVVELKVVRAFDEKHSAQCLNYLKATGLPVCLMLNFGETRVKVKRFVSESYPCSSVFICGGKSDA